MVFWKQPFLCKYICYGMGKTRISLKARTVKKYYITADYPGAILSEKCYKVTHQMSPRDESFKKTKTLVSIVVGLTKDWVNPTAEKQDLVSICNAKAASRGFIV